MSKDLDTLITRLEKLAGLGKWIISLIIAFVAWAARLEFASTDHGKRLDGVEIDTKRNSNNISEIQGRLHGTASQLGKLPGKVATALRPQSDDE